MILYLDTSALVKLLVEEEGSGLVGGLVDEAEVVATSRVALAEAVAALGRAEREGSLDAEGLASAVEAVRRVWPDLLRVEVNEQRAADLALAHVLRGFDAIHLAAALDCREAAVSARVEFVSFDRRQRQAAVAEGFPAAVRG